ncbi:unnamed protein product [Tilletia controversa]|uniref:Pali-domain-containing protein n=1 Tax=Tilletia laevis TaxID=157183 RepID=A0A9N8QC02_9BASI|nr:unnamed protein product [Tilletia laevis]CAD6921817.1 unnamed protein product [Tilletia controversa]CAD6929726.1 unnamed protein product [Tilletia caries]CAD6955975.1 unnamed protein product [Tilletia controversa]CAD6968326.1 unnamed protein product [Tilletia controversa]
MARTFSIFSIVAGFCAFVLLVLCTVSLPTTLNDSTPFDYVRASNLEGVNDVGIAANTDRNLSRIHLGLWGYCSSSIEKPDNFDFCDRPGHGYQVSLNATNGDRQAAYENANIQASWTRGLAIHVVAMVAAAIAVILSFVPHTLVMLIAFFVYLVAAILSEIAFIIDIVLFVYARNRIHRVSPDASVMPGPAFYFALVSIPLLLLASITVCCGRRHKKRDDEYPATTGASSTYPAPTHYAQGTTGTTGTAATDSYGMSTTKSSKQKVLDAFHASKN